MPHWPALQWQPHGAREKWILPCARPIVVAHIRLSETTAKGACNLISTWKQCKKISNVHGYIELLEIPLITMAPADVSPYSCFSTDDHTPVVQYQICIAVHEIARFAIWIFTEC
jgi:hypothetical protein